MDDTFLETYLETREIKKVRMTFRLPVSILNDTGVLSGGGREGGRERSIQCRKRDFHIARTLIPRE